MEVSFFGLDVTIPDDPVAYIKEKAIVLLNYMGYEYPVTDDSMLDSWGDKWAAIEERIGSFVSDLDDGVAHVLANNEGDALDAFMSYMHGDESNLDSLKSVAEVAPIAAAS